MGNYKNDSYWLLQIWGLYTSENAPAEGDTITISSGQLTYGTDANTIVNFADETVLKYDGTNWSVYVEQTIEEMSVDSVYNFTKEQQYWNFNFNMTGTWPTTGGLEFYTNKSVTVTIKNASGDTLATVSGEGLGNYKNGSYWLLQIWGLYTPENAPAVGDTIIISSGQLAYASDVNTIVNFAEETVLKYDGANWVMGLLDSGVDADVNSDMSVSSSDLVRLLRHRNNATVAINEEREDINYDGSKDEVDVSALRKVLLGMIYYKKADASPSIPFGTPQYYNTDTIDRMAYACPEISEFQRYKDAGLTLLNTEFVAPLKNDALTPEAQAELVAYLEAAQKYDLGVIVYSDLLSTLLEYEGNVNQHPNFGENWELLLDLYVQFLEQYPAFKGFVMSDELTIKRITNYTTIVNYLKSKYPDLMLISSQLPVYAYDDNTWGPDALTTDETKKSNKKSAYEDYVTQFGNALGHFTYDNYSLYLKERAIVSDNWYVEEDWHTNLKYVSELAKENGFTTGITIQSCYLKGNSNWLGGLNRYAPENKEDIGFQVYTALAFGMQDIHFFTYADHPTDDNVDQSMQNNENVYNAVKAVNGELNTFANVFKSYTWDQTLEIASNSTNSSTENSRLKEVESTAAKVYVGCMKDVDGFDGYMVANADDPRDAAQTSVTLTFNNATHALVYKNGERSKIKLTDGKYVVVEVAAGEGAFVIPLRIEE